MAWVITQDEVLYLSTEHHLGPHIWSEPATRNTRQPALDCEGALPLLRDEREGGGLKLVPVGHEDDLDGLRLAHARGGSGD